MMKQVTLSILFVVCMIGLSQAQDIKIKKNVIYVDGQEEATLEESPKNYWTIKSLETEDDLAFLKLIDPSKDETPDFNDNYFLLRFPDSDEDVEYKEFRLLYAIKFLYSNRVIEAGKVNIENLNEFVAKYGKK